MKFFPLVTVSALGAVLCSPMASAHGTMEYPINRTYQCYQEGPENPESEACKAAKAVGGPSPMYNWSAISQNAGGNDRAFVPDGELCSGGNSHYAGFDLARDDWVRTEINTSGPLTLSFKATAPHSTKRWSLYITKDSYDLNEPLKWSDLDHFCELGKVPLDGSQHYNLSCTLPQGYDGDRIIYAVWERDDSQETFYSCSDVRISGLGGSTADQSIGGSDETGHSGESATPAELVSPVEGSEFTRDSVVFNVSHHDSESTWLYVGTSVGGSDIFKDAITTSRTVTGIPTDGSTVYVTLWSYLDGEWQSQNLVYETADTRQGNSDVSGDQEVRIVGALKAEADLTAGQKVTLHLMDYEDNQMVDVGFYTLEIEDNMGSRHDWPWHLAKRVNAQSTDIRIGQMGGDGTLASVTPVRSADGNKVYALAGNNLHYELSISQNETANDWLELVLSASQTTVSGNAQITVSGSQSSGMDWQDAHFQWTVLSGEASIENAHALTTRVTLDAAQAGQDVVLELRVTDGDTSVAKTLTIHHVLADDNGSESASDEQPVRIELGFGGSGSSGGTMGWGLLIPIFLLSLWRRRFP